jgi:hypothetical protein
MLYAYFQNVFFNSLKFPVLWKTAKIKGRAKIWTASLYSFETRSYAVALQQFQKQLG